MGNSLKLIATLVTAGIIISASFTILYFNGDIINTRVKSPSVVAAMEGKVTYYFNSTEQAKSLGMYLPAPANGTVQAFFSLAPPDYVNSSDIPLVQDDTMVSLGTGNITNGSFSFNLSYNIFTYSEGWMSYLNERQIRTSIDITLEINIFRDFHNGTNIYTFVKFIKFDPFKISLRSPLIFSLGNMSFHLVTPSVTVYNNYSSNTNVTSAVSSLLTHGGVCEQPYQVINSTTYTWEVDKAASFDNIKFPLLVFHNNTTADYSKIGNYVGSASLGFTNDQVSFTAAQGYANNTNDLTEINNWKMSVTTSTSTSTSFVGSDSIEYPTRESSGYNSTAYIYLSGANLELAKYQLYENKLTQYYHSGVLCKQTLISSPTDNYQVQEYLESGSFGNNTTVDLGYLPYQVGTLLAWIDHNQTAATGTMDFNDSVQIGILGSSIDASVRSSLEKVLNTVEFGFAAIGTALAIAGVAMALAASGGVLSGGPAAVYLAVSSLIFSEASLDLSIVSSIESMMISSSSVTSVYTSNVVDFASGTTLYVLYMEPETVQFDNVAVKLASPYVALSDP